MNSLRWREETRVIVLWSCKQCVTIKHRQRCGRRSIETESALAHLQPYSCNRQWSIVAVIDRNLDHRRTLHIRSKCRRHTELLLFDLATGLRKVHPKDRSTK